MKIFRNMLIAVTIQLLFGIPALSQKYQNGTRLLKGAEVLSATPLQLDYVLEDLADTTKIKINLHEGKTHLVLNDGSGMWREWWYYMGKWQLKTQGGASSNGKEGSIQTKSGEGFAGSLLAVNEGFIYSLDPVPSDVGLNNKNATIRVTPQSKALMEATRNGITSNVCVSASNTDHSVTWLSQKKRGATMRMDTINLVHQSLMPDYWNFISSLPDTTFYIKKRIRFDQPKTSVYSKNGDLRLSDKSGDYALSDLLGSSSSGSVSSVGLSMPDLFTVTGSPVTGSGTLSATLNQQTKNTVLAAPATANGVPVFRTLQETDIPNLNWNKITNTPLTLAGYQIGNAYTKTEIDEKLHIKENNQLLYVHNNRPAGIPHSSVNTGAYSTEISFSGYDKYWDYPDPRHPATITAENTGFHIGSHWMDVGNQIDTRSGRLYFNSYNYENNKYKSIFIIQPTEIIQESHVNSIRADQIYLESENEGQTDKAVSALTPEYQSFKISSKHGEDTYHTELEIRDGYMTFGRMHEKDHIGMPMAGNLFIGENFQYDKYFRYIPLDTTMSVYHSLALDCYDDAKVATIALTEEKDMVFNSNACEALDKSSITLTEIIQKGQIITQASEPAIPNESYAFWISGSNFYIILRSGGVQKKIQFP